MKTINRFKFNFNKDSFRFNFFSIVILPTIQIRYTKNGIGILFPKLEIAIVWLIYSVTFSCIGEHKQQYNNRFFNKHLDKLSKI